MRGQKAPSAKRCIKTIPPLCVIAHTPTLVRKHRAPNGALRRHRHHTTIRIARERRQKAPSAKRCIKTWVCSPATCVAAWSESTERQKVH